MKILVTGGAGYIGSHATLALLEAGLELVVLDNLCNSSDESLRRVSQLAGRAPFFVKGDIRDRTLLDCLFSEHEIKAVLHFAGLKSVGESVNHPLKYFSNNIHGTHVLLEAMTHAEVFSFVFSSSATIYGDPAKIPISEDCPVGQITNPYGRSKLMVENMLRDLAISDPRWRIAILRYFNPVGAHKSGQIGEDPDGIPNNLLPYIAQVATGELPDLAIFGNDYPTHDGTGVRDYIHVVDLVEAHLCALDSLKDVTGVNVWNLGTGHGYSVLDIVRAFEYVSGKSVPHHFAPRRLGDVAICFADPKKAKLELGWEAKRGLYEMMLDAWRWQSMNPKGYKIN